MAFRFSDTGAIDFAPSKMLTRTKKMVTSSPIRPGIASGLMRKDTQDTITNNMHVR